MTTIAFIGLGNMGMGMAVNLAKAGHAVRAFDINDAARSKAAENGCVDGGTLKDAVTDADVVITMLPAGRHVSMVYGDEGGIFSHAKAGALFIDSSTIDVTTARKVINEAVHLGYRMIDAPVSGGVAGAAAGTLTFMCGGTDETYGAAKPYLDIMGKNVFHAGDAGNGQVAKIANNMLLGIHMIGTCEAFAMAQKLGLDPQTFYDISSVSSGQNWSMTSYCPVPGVGPQSPSDNDYQGGFATGLMLKDLRLAMEAAENSDAAVPLGARAASLYEGFAGAGNGGLDFSAIIKTY